MADPIDAARPSVSVILPTLNEGRRLGRCLESIRAQAYPQDRVEILVADGGSTDATVEIAEGHGCRLVDAAGLLAEAAKGRALELATGELIAMVDADNTISSPDWLSLAVEALAEQPGALGFESYYALDPADPALNRYLTGLLQISDPWARTVARRLRRVGAAPSGAEVFELPPDGAYPTGANGFVFPRRHLEALGDRPFHEATFFPQLIRSGVRRLLKHPRARVHHDYVRGWGDYFRKKQRVAMHYLLRRDDVDGGWDADLPAPRRWGAMLYCASFAGPLAESFALALRDRRTEWLLHAPASAAAVAATVTGIAKSRFSASRDDRVRASRALKPRD
ncbi:MAG: glycosyltransferase family 2 protein [Acidobacteriota bacterium]